MSHPCQAHVTRAGDCPTCGRRWPRGETEPCVKPAHWCDKGGYTYCASHKPKDAMRVEEFDAYLQARGKHE